MSQSNKSKVISTFGMYMVIVFAIIGKNVLLNKLDFNYQMFEDTFNLQYFVTDIGVTLVFIFVGLKFFTWLYPKEK